MRSANIIMYLYMYLAVMLLFCTDSNVFVRFVSYNIGQEYGLDHVYGIISSANDIAIW